TGEPDVCRSREDLPMRTSVVLLILLAATVRADDDLTVLKSGPGDVAPRKMLATYLRGECQNHFVARKKAIAEFFPTDPMKHNPEVLREKFIARQKEMREKFIAALGGFPEKTPLNAQVVGTIERKGFRIEKVIFESRPQHHVTANLYLPPGKGPFP